MSYEASVFKKENLDKKNLSEVGLIWSKQTLFDSSSLQSWTKYLEQRKEVQPNWTGLQNLDIVLFYCYCHNLISGKETALGYVSIQI